jgi:uncharacterized protein YjbI with pentapeptide repeats
VMFIQCSLRDVSFAGSRLDHVDFLGCDLAGTDFRGAELLSVSYDESNDRSALFDDGVRFSRALLHDGVQWSPGSPKSVIYHRAAAAPKI